MGKVITSPVDKYPGEVVLYDPLTLPMVAAFENALLSIRGQRSAAGVDLLILPAVLMCVQEWHIQGVPEHPTENNFPVKPHRARRELLAWLTGELTKLYEDDPEAPNE